MHAGPLQSFDEPALFETLGQSDGGIGLHALVPVDQSALHSCLAAASVDAYRLGSFGSGS
jgi:hypothetical protein